MKTKLLLKTALLLPAVIAVCAVHWSEPGPVVASCQQQRVISESGIETLQLQCNHTPQQSWVSWAQGQSRSTQFHFIDLLELLNRLHSHQDSK